MNTNQQSVNVSDGEPMFDTLALTTKKKKLEIELVMGYEIVRHKQTYGELTPYEERSMLKKVTEYVEELNNK